MAVMPKPTSRKPSEKTNSPNPKACKNSDRVMDSPPVTRRRTLVGTVLKTLDAWERYRRSGNAANGDEAIRGFMENMLHTVDWASFKPRQLRLALSAICISMPTRDLVLFRAAAERELNLLATCIADEDHLLDPKGHEIVKMIESLRGPRPRAYAAAVSFIEAMQEKQSIAEGK